MTPAPRDEQPPMGGPDSHYEILRVGRHRWAAVAAYGVGSTGVRSGYWAEDAAGGWGTSDHSALDAVEMCTRPVTYRTRREARRQPTDQQISPTRKTRRSTPKATRAAAPSTSCAEPICPTETSAKPISTTRAGSQSATKRGAIMIAPHTALTTAARQAASVALRELAARYGLSLTPSQARALVAVTLTAYDQYLDHATPKEPQS